MNNIMTITELDNLDVATYLLLFKQKSKKLYPFCLIGIEFNIAKEKLKQWILERNNGTEIILLKNGEGFFMEDVHFGKSFWYCELNSNNIIIDLYRP